MIEPEIEFNEELKKKVIDIVKRSHKFKGDTFDDSEVVILFHWVRHMHEPMYDFVPKKYRR